MSKQTEEIRNYFDRNGIALKDVAEALGISPAAVSNLLAGRDGLGKKRAQKLSSLYGFDYIYLISGVGSLFPSNEVHQQANIKTNNGTVTQQVSYPSNTHRNYSLSDECPSREELQQTVDKLRAQLDAKTSENSWLRSMIERIMPTSDTKSE